MNILFLVGGWGVGGVERVTAVLAAEFSRRGHGVTILAHRFDDRTLLNELSPSIAAIELPKKGRVAALRRILKEREIDIVINQWALPASVTMMIRRSAKGLGVKIVEVQHNAPDRNNRMLRAHRGFERLMWKMLAAFNLRIVYSLCDRYVFLTPGVADAFFKFTGIRNRDKAVVISNPVALPAMKQNCPEKENLLLYVGRLSETEKRPSRVIETWRLLADQLPDWELEIVGDGPDREALEASARGLPRISFVGFQDPSSYYRRAKLLLLTSEYEGFGLVLVEAMANGCVPIALGSCPAICDLIADSKDGILIAPPFSVEDMAYRVRQLTENDILRADLAKRGTEKARQFELSNIVVEWGSMMEGLWTRK